MRVVVDWLSPIISFLSSLSGVLLAIGIPSILLGIYVESIPRIKPERTTKMIDYPAGLQKEEHFFFVEMGRIPFVNRLFFRRKTFSTVRFVHYPTLKLRIIINSGAESYELDRKHWDFDFDGEPKLFIRRSGFPSSLDYFTIVVYVFQERSRPEIRNLLDQKTNSSREEGTCTIIHRIVNATDFFIKDFEVNIGLPDIRRFSQLTIWKMNGRREKFEYSPRDFWIRLDTPTTIDMSSTIPKKTAAVLVGIVDVEHGITELEIGYSL